MFTFNNTITADQIVRVIVDPTTPRQTTATGYGNKLPTRYRLVCEDKKIRRVYMIQYSNSGTPFVIWNGKRCRLSVGIEAMMERAAAR